MTAAPLQLSFPESKLPVGKIAELDGLRGIAVLLVLWAHLPRELFGEWASYLNYFVQPGYLGVDIFFVLSGFLITRILLIDRARSRPLRYFLARRALRIFPIFYLMILICLVVAPGEYLWWCATYLQNFFFSWNHEPGPLRHTWSLAVEEHFYLVWPVLVYAMPVRWSRVAAVALIVIAVAIAIGLTLSAVTIAGDLIYRGSMVRMGSLAAGALFAYREERLRRDMRLTIALIGCLFAAAVMIVGTGRMMPPAWMPATKVIGFGAVSAALVLGTIVIHVKAVPWAWGLRQGPLPYLGRISYGIYLYHFPLFGLFGLLSVFEISRVPTPSGAVLAVIATIAVATLSFYAIELPLLRLKERLR